MQIRKLERVDADMCIKGMVYGDPGSGKTAFGATAAECDGMSDVLIVNIEGGMLTVRDMELKNTPLEIRIQKPGDMEELFWALKKKSEEFSTVRTVVIDSATEWVARDLEATVMGNMSKTSRGGKRRKGIDDAWLEDRGETNQRIARLMRWYRDLDLNVIVTAHPRYIYEVTEDGMQVRDKMPKWVEPAFGPALNKHLCGYMDFVWFLKNNPTKGNIDVLTSRTDRYYAKTRGATLATRLGSVLQWEAGDPILCNLHTAITQNAPFEMKEATPDE